jgi:nitrite reductase/ring-hydroxylating ferredoxin subunit
LSSPGRHAILIDMKWTTLCRLDDLIEGLGKYVEIDGFSLAIFLQGDAVHVMDNHCPHAGGSMSGGYIDDGCAVCPWHGWAFDVKTGKLRGGIGDDEMLPIYPSRILIEPGGKFVQTVLPSAKV